MDGSGTGIARGGAEDVDRLSARATLILVEIPEELEREGEEERLRAADSFAVYLNQIGKIPLLTARQEVEIGRRIEVGQLELRTALVGTMLSAVATGATYAVLLWLLWTGRMALAASA